MPNNYANEWRTVTGPVTPKQIRGDREAYSVLLSMHKQYYESCAQDFVRMASSKAEMLVDSTLNTDIRLTAALLRNMKPWQPRRQLRLMDLVGLPAASYVQEKEIIQTHFCTMLEGKSTTMEQHIDDQRNQMAGSACMNSTVTRVLKDVPATTFLQKKNAAAKKYKAISDSRLGPDVH